MWLLTFTGLILASLALPVFAGDFEDGRQFAANRDYTRAVESFKKAAEQGNMVPNSTWV